MTEEKAKRPYRGRVVVRPKSRHIWRTNLAVPDELSVKIEREAALDFRTYKLEIVALVAEAIEARELKRQTQDTL
jgi:post-segregation antitoxin (ccd killing protein)